MNSISLKIKQKNIPCDKSGTFWEIDSEIYIFSRLGLFVALEDGHHWTNIGLCDTTISIADIKSFINRDNTLPVTYLGYCDITLQEKENKNE